MDKFSRIWKTNSVDESAPASSVAKRRERRATPTVEEIQDDQPQNPYTEIQILAHHCDIVRHLLKVGDNCCLTAGDDGSAVLWDITLGRRLVILNGHTRPITCVLLHQRTDDLAYHANPVLWTSSSDRQIRLWNLHTGDSITSLTQHQSFVKCLVVMKSDRYIISGGEKLCIWDRKGQLLNTHLLDSEFGDVSIMIVIKNDRLVVALEKQLVVYQLTEDGEDQTPRLFLCTRLLPHRETINCLVNVSTAAFASGSLDGTVVLWGSHSLSRCRNFNSKTEYQDSSRTFPYSVQFVFTVEDHYLFVAIGAGYYIFDLAGQILAEKVNAHYSKIIAMTFVYNGEFLATCSEDGKIRLWGSNRCLRREDVGIVEQFLGVAREEFSTLRGDNPPVEPVLVGECTGHSGSVLNLMDFGPDGFVSCGVDHLAIVWRDGIVQSLRRTEVAHDLVLGAGNSL